MLTTELIDNYIAILTEELIPAMGCTEPIALALAAAKTVEYLNDSNGSVPGEFNVTDVTKTLPDRIVAKCSGNMIKNVRCVQIPNSQGMVGIEAAVALGAFGGDAKKNMEVLSAITDENRTQVLAFLKAGKCQVEFLDSDIPLHFIIEVYQGENCVSIEVRYSHTNIYKIVMNDQVIFFADSADRGSDKGFSADSGSDNNDSDNAAEVRTDRSTLTIDLIKEFADTVEIERVKHLLDKQIRYNMDIAYEGMSGDYGLGIGRVIKASYAESAITRMKAYAAAASEARMCGCDMPVIINSGSGNQGIASSVPVIVYARENNIPQEKLYRALVFSSLLTIHQKEYIGKLSAFCGAVSASCASGAAITYLAGGSNEQIKDTVGNTLANIPGIICDGAKASCAAKIATCLDAAMMASFLAMQGKSYQAYTGILKEDTEDTISCVGYIGKVGMRETDKEIINTMLK